MSIGKAGQFDTVGLSPVRWSSIWNRRNRCTASRARRFRVTITTRPPLSVGSNRYRIEVRNCFIADTPGGAVAWISIAISKFPAANASAMCWRCRRIASRLFWSAGSHDSAEMIPPCRVSLKWWAVRRWSNPITRSETAKGSQRQNRDALVGQSW